MAISRIYSLFFLALAVMVLAACSGGKPESTVEAFYRAAAKGDVDKATSLMSFENVPAAQMTQAKGKMQMIVGEMQSRIQANDGLDKVEVLESVADSAGNQANVRVKIRYKNGKEQVESHRLVKDGGDWKIFLK